jgi:NADH-quinone oxidoreductase subunit C
MACSSLAAPLSGHSPKCARWLAIALTASLTIPINPPTSNPRFPLSKFVFDKVAAKYPEAIAERYSDRAGGEWAVIRPERLPDVAAFLKRDPELDFKLFLSIDAVDRLHLPEPTPRFEVVYFIRSLLRNEAVRLKVRVSEEHPVIPSITPIYQGASWWERFVWDFYGVKFSGHPSLRRVLLYEEFKGHPLRKDYPLRARQPLIPEKPIRDIYRGPGTSGV